MQAPVEESLFSERSKTTQTFTIILDAGFNLSKMRFWCVWVTCDCGKCYKYDKCVMIIDTHLVREIPDDAKNANLEKIRMRESTPVRKKIILTKLNKAFKPLIQRLLESSNIKHSIHSQPTSLLPDNKKVVTSLVVIDILHKDHMSPSSYIESTAIDKFKRRCTMHMFFD